MKKMTRRLLCVGMALAMTLALAACGGEASKPKDSSTPPPISTPVQESTSPAPANSEPEQTKTDWIGFADWMGEDWAAKTPSYQFTGEFAQAENGIYLHFLINLYSDGSVLVDQRRLATEAMGEGSSYTYFGYWSETDTEDGNEIMMDIVSVTPLEGGELLAHEYNYALYEESDGNYSFGYTFGIVPGQYFRTVDVVGGSEIIYATVEDFYIAMNEVKIPAPEIQPEG